jgi:hypothetical protein
MEQLKRQIEGLNLVQQEQNIRSLDENIAVMQIVIRD